MQVPKGGSSSPMAGIVRVPPLLYPEQLHWYIVEQPKLHTVDNYCMISGKLELLGWRQISKEKQIKQIVFKYILNLYTSEVHDPICIDSVSLSCLLIFHERLLRHELFCGSKFFVWDQKMCWRILDLGSLSKAFGRKGNFSWWREILVECWKTTQCWMDGKTNQPTWTGEGQEISVLLLFSNVEIKIFDSKDYIAKLLWESSMCFSSSGG